MSSWRRALQLCLLRSCSRSQQLVLILEASTSVRDQPGAQRTHSWLRDTANLPAGRARWGWNRTLERLGMGCASAGRCRSPGEHSTFLRAEPGVALPFQTACLCGMRCTVPAAARPAAPAPPQPPPPPPRLRLPPAPPHPPALLPAPPLPACSEGREANLERLLEVAASAQKIVVFSGSGLSASSGGRGARRGCSRRK
jgi:hypothetical protein